MILDLGCGGNLHDGAVGIDITPNGTAASIICNLGFEPIPLDDNVADTCISHHFIEHVPMAVWAQRTEFDNRGIPTGRFVLDRILPMVFLFNEIYRVLKHDGRFKVTVPLVVNGNFSHQQGFQDPTHVSFWVPETVRYFSGDFYGFHEVYGHTSRFELVGMELRDWFMRFELRAIKNLPVDHPYLLKY